MVYAWDLESASGGTIPKPKPVQLARRSSSYERVVFSPNDKWLVAGNTLFKMTAEGPVNCTALQGYEPEFSPNGQWLITNDDWNIWLWNLRDADLPIAKPIHPRHEDESDDHPRLVFAFSKDSQWLLAYQERTVRSPASSSFKGSFHLWNLITSETSAVKLQVDTNEKGGQARSVTAAAISPDSSWLLAGTEEGKLLLWRLRGSTAEPVQLPDHNEESGADARAQITSVAFSRDSTLAAATTGNSVALVWELDANRASFNSRVLFSGNGNPSNYCEFSPDNRWLLTAGHIFNLWDLRETGRSTSFIHLDTGLYVDNLKFDENNRWLFTAARGSISDGPIQLWSLDLEDLLRLAYQRTKRN